MDIRKAISGEKNYQKPGWFVLDSIVTVRCFSCFQHLSVFDCTISKAGEVSPVICPNCKTVNSEYVLTGLDKKLSKEKGELKLK